MAWISVKKQTPEPFKYVLLTDGTCVFKGCRVSEETEKDNDNVYYFSNERYIDKVTHWMPLPSPPKD